MFYLAYGYGGYHLELDGRTIYTSDGDFDYADAYTFTAEAGTGGCAIDQEEVNWFLSFCMQTSRCKGIKPCDFEEVSPATTTEKATGDRNSLPLPEPQPLERTKTGATDLYDSISAKLEKAHELHSLGVLKKGTTW